MALVPTAPQCYHFSLVLLSLLKSLEVDLLFSLFVQERLHGGTAWDRQSVARLSTYWVALEKSSGYFLFHTVLAVFCLSPAVCFYGSAQVFPLYVCVVLFLVTCWNPSLGRSGLGRL